MTKIAIDIVLLPDSNGSNICKDINKKIGGKIDFINSSKIPHISLMMGAIDDTELDKLKEKLAIVSDSFSKISLNGKLRKYNIANTGEDGCSFELDDTVEIKSLFEYISNEIRPLLDYKNLSTDMFYRSEEVETQSIEWVKSYENMSVEKYKSHITLGIGKMPSEPKDTINFGISEMAIFQLGNYCTCENKLFELSLG